MVEGRGTVVVCGAGGFIGGHLVAELLHHGTPVRAVDIKPVAVWHQSFDRAHNVVADLRELGACRDACAGASRVYNLAADMGGMGFIEANRTACMLNVLINTHLLMAAREAGVDRYFFASSACVYNASKQSRADVTPLRESDAYPADPEDGYGWEKLFSERMCAHFAEEQGLSCVVGRLHNVYGPHGTWQGGREKAPAAICRKVIEAKHEGTGEIEIWGDGTQTRSFMWIQDCVEGILRLTERSVPEPVNLGSAELISIDGLADLAQDFGEVRLKRRYRPEAPTGVAGRNSDNARLRHWTNGWEPRTPLAKGLAETYRWIEGAYLASRAR